MSIQSESFGLEQPFLADQEPTRALRACWKPSERSVLALAFCTVLAAVGLQIAKAFGVRTALPDWVVDVFYYSDSLVGVAALGVRYRSETNRLRSESTLEEQAPEVSRVRRETVAYGFAFLAMLAALGLQLARTTGINSAALDHAGYATLAAGTVAGATGLALEYRRTRDEEVREAQRRNTIADHHWTYLRTAVSLSTCLLTLSFVGLMMASAFGNPVSSSDLKINIIVGSIALINLTGLAISYLAELANERRRAHVDWIEMKSVDEIENPQVFS